MVQEEEEVLLPLGAILLAVTAVLEVQALQTQFLARRFLTQAAEEEVLQMAERVVQRQRAVEEAQAGLPRLPEQMELPILAEEVVAVVKAPLEQGVQELSSSHT